MANNERKFDRFRHFPYEGIVPPHPPKKWCHSYRWDMDYVTNASMNCRNKMSYWIVVIVGVLFLLVINVGKSLIFAIIGLFFDQSFLKNGLFLFKIKVLLLVYYCTFSPYYINCKDCPLHSKAFCTRRIKFQYRFGKYLSPQWPNMYTRKNYFQRGHTIDSHKMSPLVQVGCELNQLYLHQSPLLTLQEPLLACGDFHRWSTIYGEQWERSTQWRVRPLPRPTVVSFWWQSHISFYGSRIYEEQWRERTTPKRV